MSTNRSTFLTPAVGSAIKAFTLFEVTLAVAILALLTGVMLTMVEKTLETSALLEAEQQRLEQRQGIIDLLRITFRTLPNRTKMISRRVTDSSGNPEQQIVFANATDVLAWGSIDEVLHSSAILGAPSQVGGAVLLSIKRILPPDLDNTGTNTNSATIDYLSYIPDEGASGDTAQWLPLLDKLKLVQWRFFDPRTMTWLDDWTDSASRPTLAELTIQYVEETDPERYVFWLPPVTPNALPKFSASTTSSSSGSRTTNGGGNGNGGNGGGSGGNGSNSSGGTTPQR
jgi:uncharacterized membrane protein YgcG